MFLFTYKIQYVMNSENEFIKEIGTVYTELNDRKGYIDADTRFNYLEQIVMNAKNAQKQIQKELRLKH